MRVDVLAIGAHPDDIELSCAGTLCSLVHQGHSVALIHLTRGEMGTRGSEALRRSEAEKAAEIIGARDMVILDCGDGGLRTGPEERRLLVEEIRRLRPEVILGPPPQDRHPDHARAHLLVRESSFYAGLQKLGSGKPHRPGAVFSYMQHSLFSPSFIVDVSPWWPKKLAAIASYGSQFWTRGVDGPQTKISTEEFHHALEGRARHFGQVIGAEFGEPFQSSGPLAVTNPLSLVPGGVR